MAVDFFLKLEDYDKKLLKGESVDEKHKDEIEILSWSWDAEQVLNIGSQSTGAGAGRITFKPLLTTQFVSRASPDLIVACASGKPFKFATLTCRISGEKPLEYLKLVFSLAAIKNYSLQGSDGNTGRAMEQLQIEFGQIVADYQPQDANGSAKGGSVKAGWNRVKNVRQDNDKISIG